MFGEDLKVHGGQVHERVCVCEFLCNSYCAFFLYSIF